MLTRSQRFMAHLIYLSHVSALLSGIRSRIRSQENTLPRESAPICHVIELTDLPIQSDLSIQLHDKWERILSGRDSGADLGEDFKSCDLSEPIRFGSR